MKATELSRYKRDRFNKNRRCKVCGVLISDNEDIQYEVHKFGHWCKYTFYHRGCFNAKDEGQVRYTEG